VQVDAVNYDDRIRRRIGGFNEGHWWRTRAKNL